MNSNAAPLRQVAILATDDTITSTLAQAKDFFYMASLNTGRQQGLGLTPGFEARVVTPDARPAISFNRDPIPAQGTIDETEPQLIILPAFWGDFDLLQQRYPQVLPWLQQQSQRGALIGAVATGAFWLAAAGLLDGREATTYWRFHDEFAHRFPKVELQRDKHLTDAGQALCAAGISSGRDLFVHLAERLCSPEVSRTLARDVFYEVQRSYTPGVIGFGGQKMHQDMAILQIQQWLEQHFAEKFRFEDVASRHGMSIRNFMRRFHQATGDKPLHYLQRLRIEMAKTLLVTGNQSIKTISYEIGYDDASFFARLFRQHTGLSPNAFRRSHQQSGREPAA
ncbi:GlxA family transcriptional regulator [Halopseudomonas pachastrellae]|uniref:GlxA family transcriptional regulator n=1 Tax=Halopseudomonas pachastrellae TaxID=254161 RepID=UPI003D7C4339